MASMTMEEKIAALLRQAEDRAVTPEESEAFSEMAEKLMIKHGIALAAVQAANLGSRVKIIQESIFLDGVYAGATSRMLYYIINGFPNLRALIFAYPYGGRKGVQIIGHELDVKMVRPLLDSLVIQVNLAISAWVIVQRRTGIWQYLSTQDKQKDKRTFMIMFGRAVRNRLIVLHAEEYAETTGAEVALRNRGSEVDAYVSLNIQTTNTRTMGQGRNSASRAGQAAGERAGIGQDSLSKHSGRALGR